MFVVLLGELSVPAELEGKDLPLFRQLLPGDCRSVPLKGVKLSHVSAKQKGLTVFWSGLFADPGVPTGNRRVPRFRDLVAGSDPPQPKGRFVVNSAPRCNSAGSACSASADADFSLPSQT